MRGIIGFNSLQAGKSIQTGVVERRGIGSNLNVSIPFKRESPSKPMFKKFAAFAASAGFNSLQAGKSIQTPTFLDPVGPWLRTPQNQTRTAHRFFTAKMRRENATNPH